MTTSVDVLTAIDNALHGDSRARGAARCDLREARAAVAKLIEAAERLVDSANPETQGWSEAVAALVRVKGA